MGVHQRQITVATLAFFAIVLSFQNCGDTSIRTLESSSNSIQSSSQDPVADVLPGQQPKVSVLANPTYLNKNITFNFSLSGPATSDVSVTCSSVDGSAQYGEHFAVSSGSFVIPQGLVTRQLIVPILKSDVNDVSFSIKIDSAVGASVGASSVRAVIPKLSISNVFQNRARLLTATGIPAPRTGGSVLWASQRWVVMGGFDFSPSLLRGGIYNPVTQQWTSMNLQGSPFEVPAGQNLIRTLANFSSTTDGKRIFVFGGYTHVSGTQLSYKNAGGIFDPISNTWEAMSLVGAPSVRADHSSVWTGSKLVIFGGSTRSNAAARFQYASVGGMYDPSTKVWTALSTQNAPSLRGFHFAAWVGQKMLVYGGTARDIGLNELNTGLGDTSNDGGLFDPESNSWTPIVGSPINIPLHQDTLVWTGSGLVATGFTNLQSTRDGTTGAVTETMNLTSYQLNLQTGVWSEIASSDTLTFSPSSFSKKIARVHFLNNSIVVLKELSSLDKGFVLNLTSKAWSMLGTAPSEPRRSILIYRYPSASNGDAIFIFGGQSRQNGSTFFSSPMIIE